MIAQELITAALLGLIGGVIPGPVLTSVFTEIIRAGFLKSIRIIFLSLAVETFVALVSLLFFSALELPESVFRMLSLGGSGVLIWIAVGLWKVRSLDTGDTVIFSTSKIITMILANGVLWSYWITICVPKALHLKEYLPGGDFIFLLLVQSGWLVSTLLVAWVFSGFREVLSKPKIIPVLFKIFSLVFVYFALDMMIRSIIFFVS